MKIIERIRKAFGLERVESEPIKIEKAPQKRSMNTLFAKKTKSVVVGEIWGANKGTFKGNVRNYLAQMNFEQFQMEQKKAYEL